MSVEYGFGIDLGTTNSAVARSNGLEVRVYQNNDQMSVTPSAVHIFKSGRLLVGKRAYNAIIEDPDNVATEFKRSMGQKVGKSFPSSGRNMSPEELSAEILKGLKDDVRHQTQEDVQRAVITVPAAFGTLQCEATARAATTAGITETYLLQEPIAASIAYGEGPAARDQYWLVFDLGGGTLDIAVVSTREGRLTVLEHQGDNMLGGKDMDRLIVENVFLPALKHEFELPEAGSPERARLMRRLRMKAEDAKIDLSTRHSVTVSIADVGLDRRGAPIEAEVEVTRVAFEKEIDPLVRTCVRLTREALSGARLSPGDLDRVILVGGPTRIPYLRAALIDGAGTALDFSIDPMTVVARGAAIFAASVDWAKPVAPSANGSGKVGLTLGYERVSSNLQASVSGGLAAPNDVEAIKVDAAGGFWTSGWVPLANDAFEDLPVSLVEGKLSQYFIYARRADGSLVDLEPNAFSIRHGLQTGTPPLPFSIGIEVVRPNGRIELDIVFPKSTTLPATRTVTYRASRQILPSKLDDYVAIKVWEGETQQDPEANMWVGAMTIPGRDLRRPIKEGAEIRLTLHIDESRRVTVDVLLPHSNESFSDGVYVPDREAKDPKEQIKKLASSLGPLLERLDAVEAAVADRDDPAEFRELTLLRGELEEMDLLVSGSGALSDDPDFASRLLERIRDIRRRIVKLEKETGPSVSTAEIDHLTGQAEPVREFTEKFGTDSQKGIGARLIRELERAKERGDKRSALRVVENLKTLKWEVLSSQDGYWKRAFEAQQQAGREFVIRQEAAKWLDVGEQAVRKGDSVSLQEAVRHLWKLRPKSDPISDSEREQITVLTKD